ncbi:hypothetical protein LWC35_26835 [Pseudonocardia kujensis]|uniref:hypothetical protein n=1 Tax=Pseudonocardia kujensis TaxID=1128675 RepID=UPI001E6097C3|nr:hypothetical protein [Pseudonocardia kujensis]MCE0766494.1 hypothetical protein [Pseudonocardia kujensis]
MTATAVQPWLPPVGRTVQALADGAGPGALVLPTALALLLAVSVTWASAVRARRD